MMSSQTSDTRFLDRFETLRRRIRRTRLMTTFCAAALAAISAIAVVAIVDYRYELDRSIRAAALAVAGSGIALWTLWRVWRTLTQWSRPRTAAELEQRYPELGQRIRTTVQYGRRHEIAEAGVTASLIEALENDTAVRTRPLGLDAVVPSGRLYAAGALAVAALVALGGTAPLNWEWRTALRRAVLDDVPYTTLAVRPGDTEVDEGKPLHVEVSLSGRTDRDVRLFSRATDDPDSGWSEQTLERDEASASREATFAARLANISEPMEYRITAGPISSELYRIGVRFPLALQQIEVEIEPPAYTGLPARTFSDGNVTALKGSHGTFRIRLDRAPSTAEAIIRRVGELAEGEEREFRVPLQIDGTTLAMQMDLTGDLRWSVVARSQDGTELPENAFRVRVREDQPPRVGFEAPGDVLEVHTLAEVLMRIQASDDYGLTNAGIVFQINSGEEHTLLQDDFAAAADAVREVEQTGRVTPRTRAVLERALPLEYFALTQKDCVVYYAFAEDNFPEGPHRTETDLRFVDIRPFRQTFRLRDPDDPMGNGGGRGFTSLEELIQRERFVLNRTIQADKRRERFNERDLSAIDRLISAQSEIADLTRELAEQLIERGVDDVDALFQAEAAMLNAVDSLSVGKYDTAALQEKDAQQHLVEARNALEILLQQSRNNSALRRALTMINLRIRQKLRRDREEDEQTARALVERLRRLASEEDQISQQLMAMSQAMQQGGGSGGGTGEGAGGEQPDEPREPEEEQLAAASSESETPEEPMAEQETGDGPQPPAMNPRELEERQYDALAEAQEVATALAELEGVTDLARERMQAALEQTDEAAGTLARGDTSQAAAQTGRASEMFGELAVQAAALLAEEAPERVAMARNMSAQIAERQRQIAEELAESGAAESQNETQPEGRGGAGERADTDPQDEAGRLAERSRTLEDVLKAIAGSQRLEDGDAADRVAELMASQDVDETLERAATLPEMLDRRRPVPQMLAEVRDTADRLEVTARELDRIYRSLVMPRIQQLRELEQEAVELQEQMNLVENGQGVQQWQQEFEELLEDLEQSGGGGAVREELAELARTGELPGTDTWRRGAAPAPFSPPALYARNIPLLVEEIQRQIQELVLIDLLADRDEATPPEYEHLVERYLKVLADEQ